MSTVTLLQPDLTGEESLAEQAYREIRRQIVTLDLAPGSLISETELQARLGLGRTPIREAIRTLASERLIDVYPRRGMFVASVDPRELAALAEVREALEPLAASLAASRRTAAEAATIDELLADIDAVGDDMHALIELDQRVHHHVYRCAHNAVLAQACEQQYMHALRIWFLALERVESLEHAVAEHKALLRAIRDGDAAAAAQVMRTHVAGFESEMQQAI